MRITPAKSGAKPYHLTGLYFISHLLKPECNQVRPPRDEAIIDGPVSCSHIHFRVPEITIVYGVTESRTLCLIVNAAPVRSTPRYAHLTQGHQTQAMKNLEMFNA